MGMNKGKRNKKVHGKCRRCGNKSYHLRKGECSSCGFGKTSKTTSKEKPRKE
jgi:large subunit ribosomal protein L37e